MEGRKKERVTMDDAVCVLVILMSAQWLPVGVADASSAFCQCYLGCFDPACIGEGWQSCHDYCCAQVCHLPADADFQRACGGGSRASACGPTSPFCRCYPGCYQDCRDILKRQDCSDYCCATCNFLGDPEFDNACLMSGRQQASACRTEATGDDTTSTTTTTAADDAAANYWSGRHGKAKAKHG